MVGVGGFTVKAALALALVAGCFWRSYGRAVATHADVLEAMARKGADLVASGWLTAETMPELTYPLERAQAFVREARGRAGGDPPASLAALEALVARYREFVDALDRVRRVATGDDARAALAEPLARVEAAADATRAALRGEGRFAAVRRAAAT